MNQIMTIKEAINTINSLKQYYNDKNEDGYVGFDDEDNEALDMASRALEVVQGMEKVFWQELAVLDMRDATEEERNSLKRYIDSISKSTGVKFDVNGVKNRVKTELEPYEDWYDAPSDEMTLEQARQAVKDLRKKLAEYLEQQPCEDCISRQAVLDKKELVELEDGQSFYCINPEDVETLPSVTPQRPKGKWIVNSCVRRNDVYHYTVYCDKCGKIWDYTTDKKDSIPSDYCPNCGSEMEGEEC